MPVSLCVLRHLYTSEFSLVEMCACRVNIRSFFVKGSRVFLAWQALSQDVQTFIITRVCSSETNLRADFLVLSNTI